MFRWRSGRWRRRRNRVIKRFKDTVARSATATTERDYFGLLAGALVGEARPLGAEPLPEEEFLLEELDADDGL